MPSSTTSRQLSVLGEFRDGLEENVGVEIESVELTDENTVELKYSICGLQDHEAIVEEIRRIAGSYIPHQEVGGFTGLEATVQHSGQDLAQWHIEVAWVHEYVAGEWDEETFLERIEDDLTAVE